MPTQSQFPSPWREFEGQEDVDQSVSPSCSLSLSSALCGPATLCSQHPTPLPSALSTPSCSFPSCPGPSPRLSRRAHLSLPSSSCVQVLSQMTGCSLSQT